MSLRAMESDINSTVEQRIFKKNEIDEIYFHGRFGFFLQIGLSLNFH